MKTIVSGLIALSVLAGIAAPASAEQFFYGDRPFNAKLFFEYLQQQSGG